MSMLLFSVATTQTLRHTLQDSVKHDYFGMRMRTVPKITGSIHAPVIVNNAPGNEATMVRLPNELKIFFINRPGEANHMMSVSSTDNGITWSAPNKEFDLPGQAYYANNLVIDTEGNLHCVFHIFDKGENGYNGRHLNLWYSRKEKNGNKWIQPRKIYDGYVGSIRSFIQLKNKRLLFSFARAIPERSGKPGGTAIDYGWHDISTLYSDDLGEKWQFSEDHLRIPVESSQTTRYGGVEPNLIELANNKLWMLIRTNKGHLYQSFSTNSGQNWQIPEKSGFISSDSPATTLRLADNRIIMIWNSNQRWDNKRTYAVGGREALHAAISADEGRTWKGFREVLLSPNKHQDEKGDRGTAYPSAVQSSDGKIVFVSGQADERAIVKFDPDWLEEKTQADEFAEGLIQWSLFGTDYTKKLPKGESGNPKAGLLVNRIKGNSDAVWNFPMAKKGKLSMNVFASPGEGMRLALTDHFSISSDTMASDNAIFDFTIPAESFKKKDEMNRIEILWDSDRQTSSVYLNNSLFSEKSFKRRPVHGLNYLRLGIPGTAPDPNGFRVRSLAISQSK